ncbi:unnamed protein product [Nippostrongylus brasiliensis]|uniref:Integrator complex subunit 4 (inferred by orthology to a human protein) n=1 Tax=Nippostrongylus brasiliensis TaxID=27835 RepID=A0A0N4XCR5_NIPBR|nr:unnamed protein product [Nippostrongylus brasiliensis]
MFNDEIVEVRLDAIAALTPLIVHGELQKEQLEIVLKCLDDAVVDSRQALRDLLAKAEFADAECMHIAKLILVLNAASNYEPIVSLLPDCVLKHYRFLRAATSDLVAPIKILEKPTEALSLTSIPSKEISGSTADILVNAYERLQEVIREPTLADRNALRRYIIEYGLILQPVSGLRDVNAISAFNEPLAGAARFIASLCEISSALESLAQVVLKGGGDISDATGTIHQEIVRIRCAEHQFSGVPSEMASFLIEAGMFLSLLESLVEMTVTPERYAHTVLRIRSVIAEAESRWAATGESCEQAVSLIAGILEPLDGPEWDSKKILSVGAFGHLLVTHAPFLPDVFPNIGDIKAKWAQISEPNRDVAIEKPLRFVAGLPCAVRLVATLHNVTENDRHNLRVQVDYPNNTRGYFRPLSTDISEEGDRISSLVLISSSEAWSDAADVILTLVLMTDSSQQAVSVPLLDSPSSAQPATVRLRAHPMTRT